MGRVHNDGNRNRDVSALVAELEALGVDIRSARETFAELAARAAVLAERLDDVRLADIVAEVLPELDELRNERDPLTVDIRRESYP